jgi:Ser/Thr protein kinase RdoA (MazF antagonist)
VRYKPERRAVIRWDLGFKNDQKQRLRSTTWMRMVAEPMPARQALVAAAAGAGIRVPELLTAPHDRLLLETHLAGRPWELADRAAIPVVAQALARLHNAPAPAGARVHDAAAELELVRRAVDDLARLDPGLAARAEPVAGRLLRAPAPPSPPRVLHGDFHRGQVLLDADVALCDFDRACIGPAGVDLAALHAHTVLDGDAGGAFAAAFAAAYARAAEAPSERERAWWNACALLRMVTAPFRSLRADWPAACAALFAAAADAAAEAGR